MYNEWWMIETNQCKIMRIYSHSKPFLSPHRQSFHLRLEFTYWKNGQAISFDLGSFVKWLWVWNRCKFWVCYVKNNEWKEKKNENLLLRDNKDRQVKSLQRCYIREKAKEGGLKKIWKRNKEVKIYGFTPKCLMNLSILLSREANLSKQKVNNVLRWEFSKSHT